MSEEDKKGERGADIYKTVMRVLSVIALVVFIAILLVQFKLLVNVSDQMKSVMESVSGSIDSSYDYNDDDGGEDIDIDIPGGGE